MWRLINYWTNTGKFKIDKITYSNGSLEQRMTLVKIKLRGVCCVLKSSSSSRYLSFRLDFLVVYKNGLIRKIRSISKLWRHKLVNKELQYTLPSISRSKDNQAMKSGQLIEDIMRNIFVKKSYTNCGRETISRPFIQSSRQSRLV